MGLVSFLSGAQGVPGSVAPINAMVAVLAIGGSRMFARWLLRKTDDSGRTVRHRVDFDAFVSYKSRVVIYGAGAAGRQLAVGLGQSREVLLLAFVDDNRALQGRDLLSVPILSQETLQTFVAEQKVDDILLAIPRLLRNNAV
jgi:FlaA1/EpsC-like NDP-sugar epimerase